MAKKRRSRGIGSVSKRGDVYYFWWTDVNGKKHAKSLRTKNRTEALGKAAELTKAVDAKDKAEVLHQAARARRLIEQQPLPLDQVWESFLKTNPTAGSGTLRNYERALVDFKNWLLKEHCEIQSFTDITDDLVVEYLNCLWRTGITANTYNYRRNALGLITKALASGFGIENNRWHDNDLRKREVKQKRLPLSARQSVDLLESLNEPSVSLPYPDECKFLVRFILFTGSRLIDAVFMCWENIDLDQGRIRYIPRKTSGKGKEAELPILHPIHQELSARSDTRENDLVFPKLAALYERNPDGLHRPLVVLIQKVTGKGADKAAGQRKVERSSYGVHSLRATFATQAAMAGCRSVWLARMLGDSLDTVDKYYIRAGYSDTTLAGFDQIPMLTTTSGDVVDVTAEKQSKEETEREQLHKLVDALSIEFVQKALQLADDYQQAQPETDG